MGDQVPGARPDMGARRRSPRYQPDEVDGVSVALLAECGKGFSLIPRANTTVLRFDRPSPYTGMRP